MVVAAATNRALPAELMHALCLVAAVKRAAVLPTQWHRAVTASSRLMLAAVNAGWQVTEVGRVMGMDRHAASKRVNTARRSDTPGTSLAVPSPGS